MLKLIPNEQAASKPKRKVKRGKQVKPILQKKQNLLITDEQKVIHTIALKFFKYKSRKASKEIIDSLIRDAHRAIIYLQKQRRRL